MAVILESVTALTAFNEVRAVQRFLHHLVSKIRIENAKAILGVLDTAEPQEMERFAMFCDGTLKVS